MAWVGYAENDDAKTVRPVAWAGIEDGYLANADITWDDTERGRGPTGTAIRSGESVCIQDFATDLQAAPWREHALQRGYRSNIALPLKDESGQTFGVFTIYSAEPNAFTPDEIRLLGELAGDLAFGITVLRARIERQHTQEKLAYLASIVEFSDDAIFSKTLDETIVSWNRGAERIYGYSAGEIVGQSVSIFVPPGLRNELSAITERLKRGERIEHLETTRHRKDGQIIHVALTISPIKDAHGQIVGASTIARDITERKRVDEEIRRLNAELEDRVRQRTAQLETANKELETFSYSVSHDLRAPLRAIDGFSRILLEDYGAKLDDAGKDSLARIHAASQRMSQLIDDLLQLSHISRAEMRRAPVVLSALARAVADELQKTEPERHVEFVIEPGLVAEADSGLMLVVLENLLGNAWKFTGKKTDAKIEFGRTTRDGVSIFFVRDNGVGFDMAYAGKLFGAFQRLHQPADFPGTGIGLATVQRIIHRHGGRVWAEAELNRGATFYFSLPP
ncbi:MAG TPA: PAS domain S-box protein, partial [Verrucomicrobiae bacterium]